MAGAATIFSRGNGRGVCGVRAGGGELGGAIVASGSGSMVDCAAAGVRGDDGIFFGDEFSKRPASKIVRAGINCRFL